MGHVGVQEVSDYTPQASQFLMGHVSVPWVSNQACGSPIKYVEVSDGSPIRHVGFRWVFDGSPMGLGCVSDRSSIIIRFSK